jgi:hypothetical protein
MCAVLNHHSNNRAVEISLHQEGDNSADGSIENPYAFSSDCVDSFPATRTSFSWLCLKSLAQIKSARTTARLLVVIFTLMAKLFFQYFIEIVVSADEIDWSFWVKQVLALLRLEFLKRQ